MVASSQTRRRRPRRPVRIVLATAVLSLAWAGQANAFFCYVFWMYGAPCPVMENGGALASNITTQISTIGSQLKEADEFRQELMRWAERINRYRSMMTNLQNMITTLGLPQSVNLVKIPENTGVAQRCGGNASITDILGAVVGFGLSDNVKKKQQEVCIRMRTMQNRQYNEMVDFMNISIPQMEALEAELRQLIASNTGAKADWQDANAQNTGKMANAKLRAEEVMGKLEMGMNEFEARMRAYNTYLASQQEVQQVLAQSSLRGQPSILGQVVKTAVLKGALEL